MVHLDEQSSNTLFEVLEDWNVQLSHCKYYQNSDYKEREPDNQNDLTSEKSKKGGVS